MGNFTTAFSDFSKMQKEFEFYIASMDGLDRAEFTAAVRDYGRVPDLPPYDDDIDT
jgi:hypothetical protein